MFGEKMEKEETIKNESKKLNKSAKCLILSDLIYTITALFAETFLVAYFNTILVNTRTNIYWCNKQ